MAAGFALMVPGAGLEPARLAAGDFESHSETEDLCGFEGCFRRKKIS
jgi:hypothetical protein